MLDFLFSFECVTRLPLSATDPEFGEESPVQLRLLFPDDETEIEQMIPGAQFCFELDED